MRQFAIITLVCTIITFGPAEISAKEVCQDLAGIESITERPDIKFIIFGETHGTQEAPSTFVESVCHVATSGKKVLVALEFHEDNMTQFTTFMESEGREQDLEKFLSLRSWGIEDGKASVAMLEMLKRLRAMYARGLDITVAPFVRVNADTSSQALYEKAMAASLLELSENADYDAVMVLVGGIHALKKQVSGLPFEPMAMHLPEQSTISISLIFSGGSVWNCVGSCESRTVKPKSKDHLNRFRVGEKQLSSKEDIKLVNGYDGLFNLGKVTASPPVRQKSEAD